MIAWDRLAVTGYTRLNLRWFKKIFICRDRHANIGQGMIGEEGFRRILNCPHFADLPLILETPPHKELLEDGYR